jgi:hypothetical protein
VLIFAIADPNEGIIPNIISDPTKKFLKNTVPNPSPRIASNIKQIAPILSRMDRFFSLIFPRVHTDPYATSIIAHADATTAPP